MATHVALCIGVDHYEDNEINDLRCAANDAEETARALRHLGYQATRLTQPHKLTLDEIYNELDSSSKLLRPGDLFLFYFAGHGKTLQAAPGSSGDQLFLLPKANAQSLTQGTLLANRGLLSWQALKQHTETAAWEGVRRLFIFDACRLPLRSSDLSTRGGKVVASYDGARVFRDMKLSVSSSKRFAATASCTVINSCRDGQEAEELPRHPNGGHGSFTAALIEEMKESAATSLKVDERLAERLHQKMRNLTQSFGDPESNGDQTPLVIGEPVLLAPIRQSNATLVLPRVTNETGQDARKSSTQDLRRHSFTETSKQEGSQPEQKVVPIEKKLSAQDQPLHQAPRQSPGPSSAAPQAAAPVRVAMIDKTPPKQSESSGFGRFALSILYTALLIFAIAAIRVYFKS